MGNFLDFGLLKEQISFEDAIDYLGLKLKRNGAQWRGACPSCKTGGDRALVITEGRGFFCFALHKGGDQIALAAHVLELPAKDAAHELASRAGIVPSRNSTSTVRSSTVPESEAGGGSKLSPLSYLEHEHDAVVAIGLDPAFCKAHGIGYAPRGVVRGSVAIPFRDETGKLLGYFGVQELTYLPHDFTPNVVPFAKKSA